MKKLPVLILLVTLLAVSPTKSFGEMYNGSMLLDDCKQFLNYMNSKEDSSVVMSSTGYCLGYLQGHIDFQQHLERNAPSEIKHCFPSFITLSQLAKITVKYLEENPNKLNKPAMPIILKAFEESFPCSESISQSSK